MQGQERELGSGAPPDTRLTRVRCPEEVNDGGNALVPEFPQEEGKISCHIRSLCVDSPAPDLMFSGSHECT